jgi:hypothetical protein
MMGPNSLKFIFQWIPRLLFLPTAFPISCAGRDNSRQSADRRLALADSARYITVENPDIT